MNCKKIQFLMSLYIADDPALAAEERLAFVHHLRNCRECAGEYEQSKFIIDIGREHWQISEDTLAFIKRASQPAGRRMTVEEGWEDLKYRISELARLEKRGKRLKLLRRVGAVAACLVVGVFAWLMLTNPTSPEKPARSLVASVPADNIRIRMLSDDGSTLIPTGWQITSVDSLRTLVINEKHRIVLNSGTTVSLEPLAQNNRVGCLVKLASGRIYAHVEHDGNPFVVATANGRAVITGTTFDVKVTNARTILVVADGSVRFESEKSVVEVTAGQTSEIIANSAPTRPQSCDVTILTAWATGPELKAVLAQIEPYSDDYDLTDLWLSANSGPFELERINYVDWVEDKRPWFEREFPWIFQLQSALTAQGIEVDYPQLLIFSGDIWQFAYPETSPQQIPILHIDPLLKTASMCGFDKRWLLENVPAAKIAINRPTTLEDRFTRLEALGKWTGCIGKMRKSSDAPDMDTLLCSLHASTYLVNTRTLAWLSMSNDCDLIDPDTKAAILALLHTQVDATNKLNGKIIQILWMSQGGPCGKCDGLVDEIMEGISTIVSVEERLLEYEPRR